MHESMHVEARGSARERRKARSASALFVYATALVAYAAICAAVIAGPLAHPAYADSFSTAMGMQSEFGRVCYQYGFNPGSPGANKYEDAECFQHNFILPIAWKTFPSGNRTVTVRGRVGLNSLMGCTLYVVNSNGTVISQAGASFTPSSSDQPPMHDISLTVNSVTSSTTSFVSCSALGGATTLMQYRYTP